MYCTVSLVVIEGQKNKICYIGRTDKKDLGTNTLETTKTGVNIVFFTSLVILSTAITVD